MNLYVGTSGYSYKEWKGSFYPKDLPAKNMLSFYAKHFRSVEINRTFRQMPTATVLEGWAEQVPADFKFVLKAPQRITHTRRLKNAEHDLQFLLEASSVLKARLGPILFQLPPNFKKDAGRLREFMTLLPPKRHSAFEFRHESWFDEEIFDLLRARDAALCLAEVDEGLTVPFVSTASWAYLRLRREDYTNAQLKTWVKRVRAQDWKDLFVFFRHEDKANGPKFAKSFMALAG